MAPVYYILGGANPWEGAIFARSLNTTDITSRFNPSDNKAGWYLLETNYDQGIDVSQSVEECKRDPGREREPLCISMILTFKPL